MRRSLPRLARALVAAGLLAGLAACGGDDPPPPVEIGAPPDDPGPAVVLDLPEDPSGAFAFDQWPTACGLVNDGVFQAVFPQVEEIERTGSNRAIDLVDGTGTPRSVMATSADCTAELGFPIDNLAVADAPGAAMQISVLAAGTPEYVDANFNAAVNDPFDVDGGDCYVVSNTVSCRTPMVAFSLTLNMAAPDQRDDETISRFTVDGEVTEFTQPYGDTGTEVSEERVAFLNENVVGPIAATVVARLTE